jgi:uncharacterized membrane protein
MSDEMAVLIASYPTQQLAETDWGVLQDMVREGAIPLDDAAVVVRNAHGESAVVKDLHKPVRKGLVIGAALAAFTPVGMIAGLVGGALAGKVTALFHEGLSQATLKDIGRFIEDNTVVLVVAGSPAAVDVVRSTLNDATGFIGATLDEHGNTIREIASTPDD